MMRVQTLQGNVPMFLFWIEVDLRMCEFQRFNQFFPGLPWNNDLIEVAAFRGNKRSRKLLAEFPNLSLDSLFLVRAGLNLFFENDLDRSFRSHDCDLRGWPRKIHIAAYVLGIHDVVSAAVRFSCNDCQTRYSRFAKRIQELGSVLDNPVPFLFRTGQKARNIFKYDQGNVKCVTKTDEPRSLDG